MTATALQLHSGLFVQGNPQQAVPLHGVKVNGELCGPSARVTVTQRFVNEEDEPVEAVYVFPLPESAAVCGFEAVVGDRVVRGEVEEREKAFDRYDDAVTQGHGAFLLEQERPNVFTVSVGNLRPGETVDVRITYVEMLPREGKGWRWTVPTTVSPRYVPPAAGGFVGQPDGERVNPPQALDVPYGVTLEGFLTDAIRIASVEGVSHPVRVRNEAGGTRVALSQHTAAMDRDFVLIVEPQENPELRAVTAVDDASDHYVQLSVTPRLPEAARQNYELIFLVDCSGSMQGPSIEQARQALQMCLRALDAGDTFDIVRFGSRYQAMWGRLRAADPAGLGAADQYAQNRVVADLGGTEILPPLEDALSRPRDPERPRRILLLTDGQVSNEREIVDLCRAHASDARVFTMGIGAGASEHLVRDVARVSGGLCEMVFPGEDIRPKVMRMFSRMREPVADSVAIDWGPLDVEMAPSNLGPLYNGQEITFFARVRPGTPVPLGLTVRLSGGAWQTEVSVDFQAPEKEGPIPFLWARNRIRDLERDLLAPNGLAGRCVVVDPRYEELVKLGKRYGLLSAATSYVAVDVRKGGPISKRTTRRVPVQLTTGWGEGAANASSVIWMCSSGCMLPVMQALSFGGNRNRRDSMDSRRPDKPVLRAMVITDAFDHDQKWEKSGSGDSQDLYELLLTQNVDGSFPLTDALRKWLGGRRYESLCAAVRRHGDAIVTAVVVALLEKEAAHRYSEWAMAVRKARRFLEQSGVPFDPDSVFSLVF